MRVLQVGKFYPIKGGVEKVMYDLANGLSGKGIHSDMLCASENRQYQEVSLNGGSVLYAMPSLFKRFGTMVSPQLITQLRRIADNYDIIHIHHPDPMAAFALWFSDYKGKVIVHWHSDIIKQKNLLKLIMPLQNWLLRRADLIVGTTPVYVKESPHLKNFQNKVTCLPIGIMPLKYNKQEVEKIQQYYSGKKIIFSLGRLVKYKGFKYLVEAAKELSDDYIVLIGGTGPLEKELSNQIKKLNLENKVKLLGRISNEDLANYYGACDLYCLSSIMKTEAFAIVQIEAMSLGKPIVATKIPHSGVAWVNADGVSGFNVDIKNPSEIAVAIRKILEDKDLYENLSDGSIKRFHDVFMEDKMIESCISLYNQVLCKKNK